MSRIAFVCIFTILFAQKIFAQTYIPVSGDTSGYTSGSFSVTDAGASSYSLPIVVSPGTAGLQPSISISYSSQGSNGLIGLGWSLQGLSVISRSAQTLAQDNQIKGISFSSNDRFALDGERLILTDLTTLYGGNNAEYRTEQNAFYKIISYSTGTTPTYFKVQTNSGLTMEYGNTSDSRILVNGNTPAFWLVSKITDTKGNYYTFSYTQNSTTGEYYPAQINYTGNAAMGLLPYASVKFEYENRLDSIVQYSNDIRIVSSTKRLKAIKCFYETTLVRSYTLAYQYSPTNISELVSLKECGMGSQCNAPTTLVWSNLAQPSFTTTGITNIPQNAAQDRTFNTDINSDGVQDIIGLVRGSALQAYIGNKKSTGLAYQSVSFNPSIIVTNGKITTTDFNADGKEDIVLFDSVLGANIVYVNTTSVGATQITSNPQTNVIPSSIYSNNKPVINADFNGDGLADILSYDPATGNNSWMFSTSSDSTISFLPNGSTGIFSNLLPASLFVNYLPNYGDFNSDGLIDILFYAPYNGTTYLYRNNGGSPASFTLAATNFITPALITNGGLSIQDMNGDGLPDVMFYVKASGINRWWFNNGGTVFTSITANPANLNTLISGGDNLMHVDFNADGYTDLLWIDKATGTNRWLANDGKLNFTLLPGTIINSADIKLYDIIGAGNFTSKSNFDLFAFNNSGIPRIKIIQSAKQYNNLISKIIPGNEDTIQIEYDYLTSDSLYTKSDSATYPLMDYQATQFVVKSYKTNDGIGGYKKVSHHYSGAKLHVGGRGFRGFSQIDVVDETTGISQSKYYLSSADCWKYISSPLVKTVTKLPNSIIISQTDLENKLKIFYSGKCHYSYLSANHSKTFELDGSFVDSTYTTQEYDDYGNVTATVTHYGGGSKDSLVNVFYNNPSIWVLGRLMSSKLYRMEPNKPTIVKGSAFAYDATTGLLTSETIEPDSGNTIKIIKTYQHDGFGNILSSSVTAWNGTNTETRTKISVYDSKGRFTTSFTNEIGQVSSATCDQFLGHSLTETNINNQTVTKVYDGLGRLTKTTYPDGNWTSIDYRKSGSSFANRPNLAKHLIYQQSSTGPPAIKYFDLLDREIRTERKGFSGSTILQDATYDARGLVIKQTQPYFVSATPVFSQHIYDIIGRKIAEINPGNRIDSIRYNGRTTTVTNSIGQKKTIIKDVKDRMIVSRDNLGNDVNYQYDAAGRMLKITDPVGNIIQMKYDIHGNKIEQNDPDLGTYHYQINGFGEIISQTDAKSNVVTMEYDSLSRLRKRTEPEGITTWAYDSRPNGKGMLDSVVSYNKFKQVFTYDALSRVINSTERIDSQLYSFTYTYDTKGRIGKTTYPSGFSTVNEYNANGYLYRIKNGNTNAIYWTASVMNAKDEIEKQLYGNGTEVNKVYDANTDFLKQITTKKGSVFLQNNTYTYNNLGRLVQRKDIVQGKQEDFLYDSLSRLIKSQVLGFDSIIIQYDILGNIIFKSDVGRYDYGNVNAGPHQVKKITPISPALCVPGLQVNTPVNSFNKVKEITKDSFKVEILYNPDRGRNVQRMYVNGQWVRTKMYAGLYEKEVKSGDTIVTHYIKTPEGVIATYTTHSNGTAPALQYLHRDHLGSAVMVTNDTGAVVRRFSFDAWGKRRNADWSNSLTDTVGLVADRGFTGHEHYDLFDIVDMNGRIYDPVLGRFCSADPFIQDVTDLQSLNRYSYCLNSPLSYTDPSGYIWKSITRAFKSIGKAISKAVEWIGENWRQIATAVIGIAVASVTAGWGILLSGAASGFASTVSATLLSGGNIGDALKAGARGAVMTGLMSVATFGIGTIENPFLRSLSHGITQGTSEMMDGGKFFHGFYSGVVVNEFSGLGNVFDDKLTRVVTASVAGGTAAEITGGNFANGAITSAFRQMYSDMHPKENSQIVKDYSDSRLYPGISVFSSAIMPRDFAITLPGIGIFLGTRMDDLATRQHEYGHFLDYKYNFNSSKIDFYTKIGLPSFLNGASNALGYGTPHRDFWTETRANILATFWFGESLSWDFHSIYPIR